MSQLAMKSTHELPKKVILVTGPAGNLGSAVIERFRQESVSLVLLDRHPNRIKELYPDLEDSKDHLLFTGVDLTDPETVQTAVGNALRTFGRIDCLVHTTGGFQMGEQVHEITPEKWDLMMDINVKTLLNTTRPVIPAMINQKNGIIITIGAIPSLQGKKNMGSYSAAKAAVLRLTESIAAEGRSSGISAKCIIPGTIDTPDNRQAMPKADRSKWVKTETIADVIFNICFNNKPNEKDLIIRL
jgi:NADP-dependent 3-hydroxy acid dehydrogenase YdfG